MVKLKSKDNADFRRTYYVKKIEQMRNFTSNNEIEVLLYKLF